MEDFLKELADLLEKHKASITLEFEDGSPHIDVNVGDNFREFGWSIYPETIRERL
ncbi:MAG TPA: hypothetical protein VGK47_03705 [Nitrososphaeraceae archaeon]